MAVHEVSQKIGQTLVREKSEMKISVIIPVYNTGGVLATVS